MQRCNAPLHTLSPRRILHRRDISSSKRPVSRRKTARTRHLRCNFVPDHSPFHTHPTCHCHSHRLSMPHRDNRYRNAPIASNHRQHIASRTRHRTTSDLLCKCDIYRHCNQIRTFSSSAMHRRCKSFLRRCRTFAHWACNRGIAYRRGIPLRTLHSLPKHYRHIRIECHLCKAMHRLTHRTLPACASFLASLCQLPLSTQAHILGVFAAFAHTFIARFALCIIATIRTIGNFLPCIVFANKFGILVAFLSPSGTNSVQTTRVAIAPTRAVFVLLPRIINTRIYCAIAAFYSPILTRYARSVDTCNSAQHGRFAIAQTQRRVVDAHRHIIFFIATPDEHTSQYGNAQRQPIHLSHKVYFHRPLLFCSPITNIRAPTAHKQS